MAKISKWFKYQSRMGKFVDLIMLINVRDFKLKKVSIHVATYVTSWFWFNKKDMTAKLKRCILFRLPITFFAVISAMRCSNPLANTDLRVSLRE